MRAVQNTDGTFFEPLIPFFLVSNGTGTVM